MKGAAGAGMDERILVPGGIPAKRGRKPLGDAAMSGAQQMARCRAGKNARRLQHIAILDMETDPFDDKTKAAILPFVAELYSDQFGAIVIWDDDFNSFVEKLAAAIEALPDEYTIYAHNGGKFDYMFLVSKIRGVVKFKGRAIMCCKIGRHELRDSLHILPEKLAAWKKDHFDYSKMKRGNRAKYRDEILAYLHSDCVYLFDIVKSFIKEFGLKISIGQAAFTELKKSYKVQHVSEQSDEFLRRYFFGGRVECIAGRGIFDSLSQRDGYKLYDVNSMYPYVMANCKHPISNEYNWRRGNPSGDSVFVDVECRNDGAFVSRTGELEAGTEKDRGRFYTTIHEFNVAVKYNLISDVEIIGVVDCREQSTFEKFIVPMYDRRRAGKVEMEKLRVAGLEASTDFEELKKQDLFLKYLLNNAYGKFAQNPRKFKEYYYTDAGKMPEAEWMEFLQGADDDTIHRYSMPVERTDEFEVWAKPSPGRRFNNVGTAASITGAARAVLLEAMQHALDPIYCDTDSLIARRLDNVTIDVSALGAWKIEQEFDRVIVCGKKEYACEVRGYPDGHDKRIKIRCKGASGLVWRDFEAMLDGQIIEALNKAPTITRTGNQYYMKRRIRATAPRRLAHARSRHVPNAKHSKAG